MRLQKIVLMTKHCPNFLIYLIFLHFHKCRSICNHWDFFFFLKPVSLSLHRGTVGMFNNIFSNKRCNKNNICYRRKIQSCKFGLNMILFLLLHAFPNFIGFLKKIARQNMLMVHVNKKFLISCFYLFLSCSYLYHIWLFPRLMHLCGDIEKTLGPLKDFSQTFATGHWNLNSSTAHNFTKVA